MKYEKLSADIRDGLDDDAKADDLLDTSADIALMRRVASVLLDRAPKSASEVVKQASVMSGREFERRKQSGELIAKDKLLQIASRIASAVSNVCVANELPDFLVDEIRAAIVQAVQD